MHINSASLPSLKSMLIIFMMIYYLNRLIGSKGIKWCKHIS